LSNLCDMANENSNRITFRADAEIAPLIRFEAERSFGSNVSKLINEWLKDRLVNDGHMAEGLDDLALYHEAKQMGCPIRSLVTEWIEEKNMEASA